MNVKDLLLGKVGNVFHRAVYKATKGKVLGNFLDMPVVILHHTGRKSGRVRDTMLTTPLIAGDSIVLVASWGGDDRHPQWYRNVIAHPAVEMTIYAKRGDYTARGAEGAERERLWAELTDSHANYAGYQAKTDRKIPVLVLEPR